jgi:RNA polymerase sigma-70 factor, ECF subfamily
VDKTERDSALASARQGDEWGITCLFRAFQPQLLNYVRHKAADVAEEVVADTWLAAAKGLATFEGDSGDFRAYLFSIARRRVADHYRSRARRPRLVALDEEAEHPAPDSADTAIEGMSTSQAIEALGRYLTAEQAEVVLLRVVADLSVEQVGKVLGRSPGSVRVIQHRALRRLAEVWQPQRVTR